MKNEMIPHEQVSGALLFRQATDAAGLCKEIVVRTAKNIQGRKFVPVEGWQSIAVAHGCVASAGHVERVEGGFRAIGYIRRMDTGQEISTAEGFVGDDEPSWAKRPEYARRAMAQTRAISRACRSAFAHVVVMMNAGLQTTPAEEMTFDDQGAGSNSYPPSAATDSGAAGGPATSETRTETLRRMCNDAHTAVKDILSKAGVQSAEEMSEEDWGSAVRMLKKKAASVRAAA